MDKMKKSEEIYTLIKQVALTGITFICLFLYFMLLPMVKDFGLPNGARLMIELSIIFAIVFTVLICILGNIYEDMKLKEKK